MIDLDPENPQDVQQRLLQVLDRNPAMAFIMTDAEDFHPGGPNDAARNCLFLDGHVDWFALPAESSDEDAGEGEGDPP